MSEIFSTGTAGNTLAFAQNPFQTGGAERSFSGLNIPNVFTFSLTENVPFFKEQHGLIGHVLGGWAFSGSYILGSGQPYTPRQGAVFGAINSTLRYTGDTANYFDSAFVGAFVTDSAHPFYGNLNAPINTTGIYCGDLGHLFGANSVAASNTFCAGVGGVNTLLSFNALNAGGIITTPGPNLGLFDARGCLNGNVTCPLVPTTKDAVHFIVNMHTAESIFGTPFGNVPRNALSDAKSNRLDASIFKNIKLGERSNFEMRLSATNALNHFNFGSINPNVEWSGLSGSDIRNFGLPFADPSTTGANGRVVSISGRFTF